MSRSDTQYLMNLTKEIIVAKLSASSPSSSNENVGVLIGDMYQAIYNKLSDIYFSDPNKTT